MLIAAAPGALLWPAAIVVWGPGHVSAAHRHHCLQLVMALDGTVRARCGAERTWVECSAVLVRPDVVHEIAANNVPTLIAFVDAESELGAALGDRIDGDNACVAPPVVARWRAMLGEASAVDPIRVEQWVREELLQGRRPVKLHPKVMLVLQYLRENIASYDELSLPKIAGEVGLSPSRLMHVFTQSTGVPIRPYVRWLRLQRAAGELARGSSITAAAHQAGFSDAAHLTRTFRQMLGATPSEIMRQSAGAAGASVSVE
jgi:AraC-like DNA-binding protein